MKKEDLIKYFKVFDIEIEEIDDFEIMIKFNKSGKGFIFIQKDQVTIKEASNKKNPKIFSNNNFKNFNFIIDYDKKMEVILKERSKENFFDIKFLIKTSKISSIIKKEKYDEESYVLLLFSRLLQFIKDEISRMEEKERFISY